MVATKDGLAEPREVPDAELAHFELADQEGNWWPAEAKIDGGLLSFGATRFKSPSRCVMPIRSVRKTATCTTETASRPRRSAPIRNCSNTIRDCPNEVQTSPIDSCWAGEFPGLTTLNDRMPTNTSADDTVADAQRGSDRPPYLSKITCGNPCVVFSLIAFAAIILLPMCLDPREGPVPELPGVPLGFDFERPCGIIEMMILVRSAGWLASAAVGAVVGTILGVISFGALKLPLK
jgi:hypothetical protein